MQKLIEVTMARFANGVGYFKAWHEEHVNDHMGVHFGNFFKLLAPWWLLGKMALKSMIALSPGQSCHRGREYHG